MHGVHTNLRRRTHNTHFSHPDFQVKANLITKPPSQPVMRNLCRLQAPLHRVQPRLCPLPTPRSLYIVRGDRQRSERR
eukprot:759588-Pyramimonas_sp.AAC.1